MTLNAQAFIDDSYSPNGEFVLGGHIAPAEVWGEFSKEWEKLLPSATRAKNGKYHFKMSEMARSPRFMEQVQDFYRVIEKYVTASISCRLNLADFKVALDHVKTRFAIMNVTINFRRWENPFFFLYRGLMDEFHSKRDQIADVIPVSEKIDFIFDESADKKSILKGWAGDTTHFARDYVEECLAHKVGNAVERAYRRQDALNKRRVIMQTWSDYCGGLASP